MNALRRGSVTAFGREVVAAASAATAAFFRAGCPSQSAALAFYALLSCVPIFFVMLVGYTLIVGENWTAQMVLKHQMALMAPFLDEALVRRARHLLWAWPGLGWQSLAFILWASWLFVGELKRALSLPWREDRPTARLWPTRMLAVVRAPFLGALCVAAMTVALYCAHLPRLEPAGSLLRRFSALWGVACLTGFFGVVYLLFVPMRRPVLLGVVSALLAGAVFCVSTVFSAVIAGLPRYHQVYGPLSGAILFLLWLDYNACVLLWGVWFLRVWQKRHPAPAGRRRLAVGPLIARLRKRRVGTAAAPGPATASHTSPSPKS